jgi:hypothetical protein
MAEAIDKNRLKIGGYTYGIDKQAILYGFRQRANAAGS